MNLIMTLTVLQLGSNIEALAGLFGVALALIFAFYINRDATNRGSSHALAWGFGAFFGGPIVWLLYYFVRDEVGPSNPN